MTDGENSETHTNSPKQPLYKYVTGEVALKILQGTIRFTQPSAFNDPFELLPEIITPTNKKDHPLGINFDLHAPRRSENVLNSTDVPDGFVVNDVLSRDIIQQLNAAVGILSLTKVNDSLLMWSHYADHYAGALIEFNGAHEFFSGQIDVHYQKARPRLHIDTYLSGKTVPIAELCTKAEQWEYEREVRLLRNLEDCQDSGIKHRGHPVFTMPIPKDSITGIFMGERMPVETQRLVYDQIKDTSLFLILAAIAQTDFAFRNEIIKYPGSPLHTGPWITPRTAHIFSHLNSPRGEMARALLEKHPMSKFVNVPI